MTRLLLALFSLLLSSQAFAAYATGGNILQKPTKYNTSTGYLTLDIDWSGMASVTTSMVITNTSPIPVSDTRTAAAAESILDRASDLTGTARRTDAAAQSVSATALSISASAASLAARDALRPLGSVASPYAVRLSGTVDYYDGTALGIGASPIIANGARITTTVVPYGVYKDFLLVFKTAATSNITTLDVQPCLCDGTILFNAVQWEGAASITLGTGATQTAIWKWNISQTSASNSSQAINVGVAAFNANIASLGTAPCMRFGIRNSTAANLTGAAGTDNIQFFGSR